MGCSISTTIGNGMYGVKVLLTLIAATVGGWTEFRFVWMISACLHMWYTIDSNTFPWCAPAVAWSICLAFGVELFVVWGYAMSTDSFRERVTRGELHLKGNGYTLHLHDLSE